MKNSIIELNNNELKLISGGVIDPVTASIMIGVAGYSLIAFIITYANRAYKRKKD